VATAAHLLTNGRAIKKKAQSQNVFPHRYRYVRRRGGSLFPSSSSSSSSSSPSARNTGTVEERKVIKGGWMRCLKGEGESEGGWWDEYDRERAEEIKASLD